MLRAILDIPDIQVFHARHRFQAHCAFLLSDPAQSIDNKEKTLSDQNLHPSIWIAANMSELDEQQPFDSVLKHRAGTIYLRGCRGPEDVEKASVLLTVFEIEAGISANSIRIAAACADSPHAVQNLSRWSSRPDRLDSLVYDPMALARASGLASAFNLTGERLPLLDTAAHMSLFASIALNCPIYDGTVWPTDSNPSANYLSALQLGFAGALTRDPEHIDLIEALFERARQ